MENYAVRKEPLEIIRWKKKKKITAHRAKNTFCFHQAKWKNFLRKVSPSGVPEHTASSAAVLVLEERPHTCVKLIFDKGVKIIQWDFSTKDAGISRYLQKIKKKKKKEPQFLAYSIHKNKTDHKTKSGRYNYNSYKRKYRRKYLWSRTKIS